MFKYYKMARVRFERYLDKNDFGMGITATDITLIADKWTEIGSYQVPAQQEIAFGVGKTSENGVDSRRDATIVIMDATTSITNGKLRLAYSDSNGVTVQPIQEDLLANWDGGVALGEVTGLRVREDSYLKVLVNSDTAHVIDMSVATNQADIPATVYML